MTDTTTNFEAAIECAASGGTMDDVARALGCSYRHLWRLTEKHPSFGQSLTRAREIGLQIQGDKLRTLVRDNPDIDVQRLKLESDNIKWALSRFLPKIFGDRLDVSVSERVDVSLAITEARGRILRHGRDSEMIEDAQVIDLPVIPDIRAADGISVDAARPVANPFDD